MTTERGATIFQVWHDVGFEVYTPSGAPNEIDPLYEWLSTSP